MPTTTPNTILYKGRLSRRYEEARVKASATVYPGMIVEKYTDGTVWPHQTAGAAALMQIAIEDGFGPMSANFFVGKKLTDPYNAGDLCRYILADKGEMFYLILKDGEVATIGSKLTSNGDGKVQILAGSEIPLAVAEEALSPSGVDYYILVTVF